MQSVYLIGWRVAQSDLETNADSIVSIRVI